MALARTQDQQERVGKLGRGDEEFGIGIFNSDRMALAFALDSHLDSLFVVELTDHR